MDLPDWISPFVVRGWDGTEFQNARVNTDGNFEMFIKALFGATQKNVQCDTNGNLTLNLKSQDLAEVINRPKYGGALLATGTKTFDGAWNGELLDVSGKGQTYFATMLSSPSVDRSSDSIQITVDGQNLSPHTISQLYTYGADKPLSYPVFIQHFDNDIFYYVIGMSYGVTFEQSLNITWSTGYTGHSVTYYITYAVV